MEQIGTKFKEKNTCKSFVLVVILMLTILIAIVWAIYTLCHSGCCCNNLCTPFATAHKIMYVKCHSGYYCNHLCTHVTFCILFLLSGILLWKIYKNDSKQNEKRKEFNRKIDWEEFQFDLHDLNNSKRFDFEKEKYLYDKINEIAKEFSKENPPKDEIKEINDKIEKLQKETENQLLVKINHITNKNNTQEDVQTTGNA